MISSNLELKKRNEVYQFFISFFDRLLKDGDPMTIDAYFNPNDWRIIAPDYIIRVIEKEYFLYKKRGYIYRKHNYYNGIKLDFGYEDKLILVHRDFIKTGFKRHFREIDLRIGERDENEHIWHYNAKKKILKNKSI